MGSNWDMAVIDLPFETTKRLFADVARDCNRREMRELADTSLYFFLVVVLGVKPALHPWVKARCDEVQREPDGRLDLWARFHFKSTIVTFARLLWDIRGNPELRTCILSNVKGLARSFQAKHKREMENNPMLHWLWPDIFWRDPRNDSPKWADNEGLIVRRRGNPTECTIESFGLTDGQPIGRHYNIINMDDAVTAESVNTPEQISKTTTSWELAQALGEQDTRFRYVGTRYHPSDTYAEMMRRGSVTVRLHAATENGKADGRPVLLSQEKLDQLKRDMKRSFGAQMLLNPISEETAMFKREWICQFERPPARRYLNVYILADPAGGKAKILTKNPNSDYTVFIVLGLCDDGNYYLLAGVRDRMNLNERTACLFSLVRQWRPTFVAYEEYGLQADIEHIRYVQERDGYRFKIIPVGGAIDKMKRIERLVGLFSEYRMWIPYRSPYKSVSGEVRDFVDEFINDEYGPCPILSHDDMLDCLARLFDAPVVFPAPRERKGLASAGEAPDAVHDDYKVI